MVKHNIAKLSIMALTIAIMASSALIINPTKVSYGQGNTTQDNTTQGNATQGNLTAVIDVDTLAKNIKERHPILAQMAGNEDQDIMVKIKGMDSKEAAKTIIALNILRLLQQYEKLDIE
ncbi:MAG: hypothetical protein QOA14_07215 [Nitrososphaeraceae archaeon]|nr:hypothetical protein [Nitrososphaeraceae archaeon]MDW0172883.1 hypothetical protein [Nitrososphaeraceae archaeon]MDW0180927.1 hypothetical protein [Nitrososphaeraceae archaeon]MDW0197272.1 hypothetical protein [Nitrososphaeraceae archaeon]MDW0206083.1 hypothetical protein [Nitrososphaeraceae archaeon]